MNFVSSERICCLESDWVLSRVLPSAPAPFDVMDDPSSALFGRGWASRSAACSIHDGCGGGPRYLFDKHCFSYEYGLDLDGLASVGHRWAEVVQDEGCFSVDVGRSLRDIRKKPISQRQPKFQIEKCLNLSQPEQLMAPKFPRVSTLR